NHGIDPLKPARNSKPAFPSAFCPYKRKWFWRSQEPRDQCRGEASSIFSTNHRFHLKQNAVGSGIDNWRASDVSLLSRTPVDVATYHQSGFEANHSVTHRRTAQALPGGRAVNRSLGRRM